MKRLLGSLGNRRKSGSSQDLRKEVESTPPPDSPPLARSSSIAVAVQERLSAEVIRKLKLAREAETKEDRDIVCGEVFADITGDLNSAARGIYPIYL